MTTARVHPEAQVVGGHVADLGQDAGGHLVRPGRSGRGSRAPRRCGPRRGPGTGPSADGLDHVVHGGPADEPLGGVEGVARVELPLPLGLVADELVPLVVDGEDRRDDEVAALVGDELHLARLAGHGGAGVGGAQVDPDDGVARRFSHGAPRLHHGRRSGNSAARPPPAAGSWATMSARRALPARPSPGGTDGLARQLGRVLHEHRAHGGHARHLRPQARRRGPGARPDHPLHRLQRLHPRARRTAARWGT